MRYPLDGSGISAQLTEADEIIGAQVARVMFDHAARRYPCRPAEAHLRPEEVARLVAIGAAIGRRLHTGAESAAPGTTEG